MNAQVTAIKHADVQGKESFYLKIETPLGTKFINIGLKTYDDITLLTSTPVQQPELFSQDNL